MRSGGYALLAALAPRAMDFQGQYYCERFFQILVVLFGLVGFVVGYIQQDFRLTFYFLATGGGVSAVVRSTSATAPLLAECARQVAWPHAGRSAYRIGRGGTGTRSTGWRWRRRRR